MGFIVYISIILLNIVCSLSSNNKKWVKNFSLFVMFLFFAFNTWNADYDNYKYHFDEYVNGIGLRYKIEIAFQLLQYYLSKITSFYSNFLLIVGFVIFIGIGYLLGELEENINVHSFIWMFMIYPFILNCIQVRSFIGFVIFFVGVILYLKKKRIGIFIGTTIFAALFHISYVIYLPFCLIILMEKKRKGKGLSLIKKILFINVPIYILFSFGKPVNILMKIIRSILAIFGSQYAYFEIEVGHHIKWFVYIIQLVILMTFLLLGFAIYRRSCIFSRYSSFDREICNIFCLINGYTLCFLPLFFLSPQVERLFRCGVVSVIIGCSMYIYKESFDKKRRCLILLLVLMLVTFMYNIVLSKSNFYEGFIPLMTKNILLPF